jgi:hypothetical protein
MSRRWSFRKAPTLAKPGCTAAYKRPQRTRGQRGSEYAADLGSPREEGGRYTRSLSRIENHVQLCDSSVLDEGNVGSRDSERFPGGIDGAPWEPAEPVGPEPRPEPDRPTVLRQGAVENFSIDGNGVERVVSTLPDIVARFASSLHQRATMGKGEMAESVASGAESNAKTIAPAALGALVVVFRGYRDEPAVRIRAVLFAEQSGHAGERLRHSVADRLGADRGRLHQIRRFHDARRL